MWDSLPQVVQWAVIIIALVVLAVAAFLALLAAAWVLGAIIWLVSLPLRLLGFAFNSTTSSANGPASLPAPAALGEPRPCGCRYAVRLPI